MNNIEKMKELIEKINAADKAYFIDDEPIMTDNEYDKLVIELTMLEKMTGIHFATSPIGKIPSDKKIELQSVPHSKPMLSCNKTKNIEEIITFKKNKELLFSWKMDGLTLVLRYEDGRFKQAITRGSDGLVGEDVTHTVKHFRNIPFVVPYKEPFEVRGEGVISFSDHDTVSKITGINSHPRNVVSGAVRALSPDVGKLNHFDFFAFELIDKKLPSKKHEHLEFLKENNFAVVEYRLLNKDATDDEIREAIGQWVPQDFKYPVDGIICEYNDYKYGVSLGATAHHEKRMIALKWRDKSKLTKFRGVELVTTRTGNVSIIALFDEITIDGTRVHKANMHNLTNFQRYKFGIGDDILVYKANMIIPQIADNITKSDNFTLPKYCPCCGEELTITTSAKGIRNLYCKNENCIARNAHKIARYCDKSAMNIEGLSVATIEKMMSFGWIKSFKDIYHLDIYAKEIVSTPGFGVDMYNALSQSIKRSKNCLMHNFLVGLGIPVLGPETAKILHQYYYGSMENFYIAIMENFPFSHIDGISPYVERSIYQWYADKGNANLLVGLMAELSFIGTPKNDINNPFSNKTVVVTGTFTDFTRDDILELLTFLGAKTSDAVTDETDFLIYGALPGETKVKDAMLHGITMISQVTFNQMISETNL